MNDKLTDRDTIVADIVSAMTESVPSVERVELSEALGKVDALNGLLHHGDPPSIEGMSLSIQYQVNFDTNFEDRNAYVTGVARYIEEATVHADMNKLIEEAQDYAAMLYTWRCCSRALPQIASNDQQNREQINTTIIEVLEPLVSKLLAFMKFTTESIKKFGEEIKRLCHPGRKNDFISEAYLLTIGKFINTFAELNDLTNMKASVKNDYTAYRRAIQSLRRMMDPQQMTESQNLSMFLATQNKIRDLLKEALETTPGYEELLADVVNNSVHMYENRLFLEPGEKSMLVKVIAFGLFLMDSKDNSIYKMDSKKRINLSKIDKILKQMEVVPLYGDMQMKPYSYIMKSVNFDSSKWNHCESNQPSQQSQILPSLQALRDSHTEYVSELARRSNERMTTSAKSARTDEENKEMYDLALRGLTNMSSWTQRVMELYCWKLLNPTDHHMNPECPQDSEEYERSTRYNYSKDEKFAIVEVIAMIKGLQLLMARMESVFLDAIRRHIYAALQDFAQIFLREPLRRAVKKKNDLIKMVIISVRDSCVDWKDGVEPVGDPASKGKKDPDTGFSIQAPRKNVAPSATQLYMVRTMLESITDRSAVGVKRSLKKELDPNHVTAINQFLKQSSYWNYLLNFNKSLHACGDLSQLWFREYFLEMTMGQRIQFPIDMSMPWILTDHILETKDPSMMEYILYPLDLYNDSGQYAIMKFHKQFLYDEVEAEVNLCFDQFVYKLSEQIFAYYKHLAGSIMLDKTFRAECAKKGHKIPYPTANRYHTLLRQQEVQILGRSIDLKHLIGQRINASLQRALDIAIARFEASDLTGILELEKLIKCNKLAHKLMKDFIPLDNFDSMLHEADNKVSSPFGRITLHVFWEISYDFLTHYCYNAATNRFIKATYLIADQCEREKAPSSSHTLTWGSKELSVAFASIFKPYQGFIGLPHFQSVCRLLGYQGISLVIEEIVKVVETNLKGTLMDYVQTLLSGMPPVCKLQLYAYGSPAIMEYYHEMLSGVIQYPDLRTDVFQSFREIGNAILLTLLMEQSLVQEEILDLKQAAPFQNVIPKPFVPIKEGDDRKQKEQELREKLNKLEVKYASQQIVPVINRHGSSQQKLLVASSDLLTKERLCCGLSMFEVVLNKIRAFLDSDIWHGQHPKNGVINIDECTEFHRLWSAIQFVYCMPVRENEYSVEELFGEGLNWAGCALIVLLSQQRRFEALDFCYHLLKVNRVDKKDGTVKGHQLSKVTGRIRRFEILNNQIFAIFNKYLKTDENTENVMENVRCFSPPIHQSCINNFIDSKIKQSIPLKEGTDTYNTWLDPPVPIYFQIYVQDLKNPIEVVKHGAKPSFVEKGPYTYREHRKKWQITHFDNGTLSYRENRSFVFDLEKSVGPHEENFTTVNLIMVTIADIIRREYSWIQELVEIVLDWGDDSNLFTTLSVKDIMWGYEDPLLKKIKAIVQKYINTTEFDDKFGLFYKQNGTDDGLYTIYSGTKSWENFNEIQLWNKEKTVPFWSTRTCNMINGTDGTIFPPFEDKGKTLYIFSSDICRSIYTVYQKEVKLKGIDLLRFAVPPRVFLNHKLNPDNEGFCTRPDLCLPSGLLNVSTCRQGAPVIMSQPHFLAADKKLVQDQVIGLTPDPEQHGTVLDVEPLTGVVMNAQKRLQLNVYIRNVSHIRDTANINHIYYPVLWLNESAVIDDKSADKFKKEVMTPIKLTEAVEYGLIVLGAFMIICTVALFIKQRVSSKPEEDLEDIHHGTNTSDKEPILN
ncbi:cytoplasmic FMR1-interacting protein 2-like [Saccostrea echinata]|uniref:cytoplasmic FMR1-interacting protein 2-like n=1 Tax=Saccostrea echinata TaxID=191078 RepID=UPI002A7F0628|nr:cytoplasmic FMR1-interacting protein 2-like [Saccostrea echinata]